jgi:hypothetical protein
MDEVSIYQDLGRGQDVTLRNMMERTDDGG